MSVEGTKSKQVIVILLMPTLLTALRDSAAGGRLSNGRTTASLAPTLLVLKMKPSEAQNLYAEKSKVIAIRGGLTLLPEKQSLVWCSTQPTTANANLPSQTYQHPSITVINKYCN